MFKVSNLHFSYPVTDKKKGNYEVIRDLSFEVRDEEFVCVIGPSGCGKSTLLKMFAGFEKPTGGEILYNGKPVTGIGYERAMVFQEDAVFPWLKVRDNVEYGLKVRKVDPKTRKERVDHFIDVVGLKGFEKSWPKELSGGMKKRVDLARVLANDPETILMDEPFGALDAMTKEMMQEELIRIWEGSKKTIVFVSLWVREHMPDVRIINREYLSIVQLAQRSLCRIIRRLLVPVVAALHGCVYPQEPNMLIPRHSRIRVVRLQAGVYLSLDRAERINASAAKANENCRRVFHLLCLLRCGHDAAARAEK